MFSDSLLQIGCLSQIKPFTSVTHQYVNNVLAITVEIMLVMPYHGPIVCFKLKRFARSRQPKNLQKIITKAKFEENPEPPFVKEVGFFPFNGCIYHRCGYFNSCKSFQFKANDKSMIWHYKRFYMRIKRNYASLKKSISL